MQLDRARAQHLVGQARPPHRTQGSEDIRHGRVDRLRRQLIRQALALPHVGQTNVRLGDRHLLQKRVHLLQNLDVESRRIDDRQQDGPARGAFDGLNVGLAQDATRTFTDAQHAFSGVRGQDPPSQPDRRPRNGRVRQVDAQQSRTVPEREVLLEVCQDRQPIEPGVIGQAHSDQRLAMIGRQLHAHRGIVAGLGQNRPNGVGRRRDPPEVFTWNRHREE